MNVKDVFRMESRFWLRLGDRLFRALLVVAKIPIYKP